MWTYNKVLEYPVKIKCPNAKLAKFIISQYGGPDGELAASLRYLSQRFGMPDQVSKAILNDIGTEELAHLEIVGSIVHQLTENVNFSLYNSNYPYTFRLFPKLLPTLILLLLFLGLRSRLQCLLLFLVQFYKVLVFQLLFQMRLPYLVHYSHFQFLGYR